MNNYTQHSKRKIMAVILILAMFFTSALPSIALAEGDPQPDDVPALDTPVFSLSGTNNAVTIKYDLVEDAEMYEIYRDDKLIATDTKGLQKYVDKVSYAQTYVYKIIAKNDEAQSESEPQSINIKLKKPSFIIQITGARSIKISWKKVAAAEKYHIYRATKSDGAYEYVTSSSGTSYVNKGLKYRQTYYYKVVAAVYETEYDSDSYIKKILLKLKAPTIKLINTSGRGITIKWSKINLAEGYSIYRATKKDGKYKHIKSVKGKTKYENTGLVKGKRYYYKVYAYDKVSGKAYKSDPSKVQSLVVIKLKWPVTGYSRTSSGYGYRTHPISGDRRLHAGIDIPCPKGTKIKAAMSGTVVHAKRSGSYGKVVFIDHGNGIQTRYAHNSKLLVKVGQKVKKGKVIAKAGSTGNSTGPHCHFEVRVYDQTYNPAKFFIK